MTTTAQANGCEFVNLTNIPEGVLKSVNAAIARIGNAIGTDGMPAKAPDGILPPKWKAIRGQQEKVMGDVRDVMCDRAIERFWDVISSESKAIAEQMSHIRACNSVRVPVVDREEAWSAVHTAACKAARSGPLANYAILFALSKLVEDRSFEGKDHYTKYVDMCWKAIEMGYVPIGMAKNDTFRVYAREVKQTAEVKDLKRDEAKTATDVKAS